MTKNHTTKKNLINLFYFTFALNPLIYGLIYFFPQSNYGEPNIPVFFKFLLDFFFLSCIACFGFKNKINIPQSIYVIFLTLVVSIGFLHSFHIGLKEYFHYSVRNSVFYGLFIIVNFFPKINSQKFDKFHEKLFKVILFFGFFLFLLKTIGIKNPFGFGGWLWEKNRLVSTWLNPNSLGFYMVFYMFYFYFKNKKVNIFSLLSIATIFLSGSLTAIIGIGLFIAYLCVQFLISSKISLKYLLLAIIILPFIIYSLIYFGILNYVVFKIDILFVQKSKIHTSVSARVNNIYHLIEYLRLNNFISILLGDFFTDKYVRLDSQYLNIFYNYGLITLTIYISFLVELQRKIKKELNSILGKTLYFFNVWLFIFAFNLTAYLYRANIIIFYFIMLLLFFNKKTTLQENAKGL